MSTQIAETVLNLTQCKVHRIEIKYGILLCHMNLPG